MVNRFSEELKKTQYDDNELDKMIAEYKKGLNGDEEYLEKYEEIGKTIEPTIQKRLINYIKRGLTLENALNQEDIPIDHDILKKWYVEGEKGNSKYRRFNAEISSALETPNKENIINHLKNGLTLGDAVNEKDVLTTLYEVKKWYKLGHNGTKRHLEFYNLSQPYLNDANIIKEKIVLNNKNFKSKRHLNKTSKNKDPSSFENKYSTSKNFLKHLRNGLSIREAIEQDDVKWDFDEFDSKYKEWGEKRYYQDAYYYKETTFFLMDESRKNIIKYLEKGLKIEEILEKNDVMHNLIELKNDYNMGFKYNSSWDDYTKYRPTKGILTFYKRLSPYLIDQNKEKIINYLKENHVLKNIFLMPDVITNKKEVEIWYKKGKNNADEHRKFYEDMFTLLKARYIKKLNEGIENGVKIKHIISDGYFDLNDIEIWNEKSNGKDPEISRLHKIKIQEEIIEIMEKENISLEDVLNKHEFYYTSDEIKNWCNPDSSGKAPFESFRKTIEEFLEKNKLQITQNKVVELVRETRDLDKVLEENEFKYSKEEIRTWYENGSYDKRYGEFRRRIDLILGENDSPRLKTNPGGFVKYNH
ncbi:MAG: hypothetical protein Q4P18_05970 [Methanobrevibacter sp.]|uniref:hypothetical protein n=1 Tax=Methanobrevibacter sp. TaxID=66852 RepID=UPI0026E018A8|nr:hypothetical protein [Methanobrevibacter sp.]MDO5849060.1 hypothetical protein [Methanobrevibacter sp.]